MIATLLSFLGGSAFRMLWGEVSAWLNKKQDHAHELERLRLQNDLDEAQHGRNMRAITVQAEMGVKTIEVAAQGKVDEVTAEAWRSAVESLGRPSGIWLVDLLNGLVRPVLAGMCILLVVLHFESVGWKLDDQGWALVGAVLGLYVADRSLFRRGK